MIRFRSVNGGAVPEIIQASAWPVAALIARSRSKVEEAESEKKGDG
jgi:hypothetical protein